MILDAFLGGGSDHKFCHNFLAILGPEEADWKRCSACPIDLHLADFLAATNFPDMMLQWPVTWTGGISVLNTMPLLPQHCYSMFHSILAFTLLPISMEIFENGVCLSFFCSSVEVSF